jgi:pyruvate-formate lyase
MDEVAQYRKYADECRALAATAKNAEHKKQLLEMAAAWDTVVRQKKSRLVKTTE